MCLCLLIRQNLHLLSEITSSIIDLHRFPTSSGQCLRHPQDCDQEENLREPGSHKTGALQRGHGQNIPDSSKIPLPRNLHEEEGADIGRLLGRRERREIRDLSGKIIRNIRVAIFWHTETCLYY